MLESSEILDVYSFTTKEEAKESFDGFALKFQSKEKRSFGEYEYIIRDVSIDYNSFPCKVKVFYTAVGRNAG